MAPTPTQLVWRERIEGGLRVAAPALNLVLAAGDRFSRWVDRNHPDSYEPARRRVVEPREPTAGSGTEAG